MIDNSKYKVVKFFNENALNKLNMWIAQSEFVEGIYSFSDCKPSDSEEYKDKLRKSKNNTETGLSAENFFNLNNPDPFCFEWGDFCHPKRNENVIISRTVAGGYYNPHFDNPANGQFSTTIFLSDPSSYEGGELGLWIDGEEKKFKLPAGHGVVYETGIPHHVNAVTKGERLVVIFWTYSTLSVREDLYKWRYLHKRLNDLIKDGKEPVSPFVGTLEEFVNDEFHKIRMEKDEIERKYVG